MKYSFLLLLLLITNTFAQSTKAINIQAEKQYDLGNYKEALDLYSKSIKIDSTDSKIYCNRAKTNYELKNFQQAQYDYEKALKLSPKSAYVYSEMGFFHKLMNYPKNAIEDCTNGLLYTEGNNNVKNVLLNTRADAYQALGAFSKAYDDYKTVLAQNPIESTEAICLVNIAKSLVKLNKNDEAISYLEQCISKHPNFIVAYNNLAFRLVEKGNYTKAIETNDKALEMIQQLKKDDKGLTEVSNKIKVANNDLLIPMIHNNRGYAKYKLGKYDDALTDVNYSIQLYPENSFAYRNRALIYIAQNKTSLACSDIQKAIDLNFESTYGSEINTLKNQYCK